MNLKVLRKKIDYLDGKMLKLLNQRAQYALEIRKLKAKKNKGIYTPERERKIYERILSLNEGPLSNSSLKAVYREIMSGVLALEKRLQIAYLGPPVTFTHLAAMGKFGASVKYLPLKSISDVFSEVEKERSDYGVVPIENSIEGAVSHTLDMFIESELKICSEIILEISHNLLANCKKSDIKKVYSNPQVFGQCRIWLETNLPRVELVEVSSTARAAEIASREKHSAAIAADLAAKVYKLKMVARGIEDTAHNITRFLIIGKRAAEATGRDKTSILFSVKDRVGALHSMLTPFRRNKINLTKIESRPSKKKAWEYYFFVDIAGHYTNKRVVKALKEIGKEAAHLKMLGSYPIAE